MFSNRNIASMLSTCTVMGYSMTAPINNKIVQVNIILQHISVISEYSDSVTYNVTDF